MAALIEGPLDHCNFGWSIRTGRGYQWQIKGGHEGRASPGVQILSISCSFWENLAKSYVDGHPPMEGWCPNLGKILNPPLATAFQSYLRSFPVKQPGSVVDPGFPRWRWGGRCEPLSLGRKPIILQDFCQKLHENERNWTEGAPASNSFNRFINVFTKISRFHEVSRYSIANKKNRKSEKKAKSQQKDVMCQLHHGQK